mmetsp:Transcript_23630/g.75841  ORF Transcript_23630/g.75841 Transcript_23630/m.75841 type:complete len:705 (-) Transcript_23630:337-2451(-)
MEAAAWKQLPMAAFIVVDGQITAVNGKFEDVMGPLFKFAEMPVGEAAAEAEDKVKFLGALEAAGRAETARVRDVRMLTRAGRSGLPIRRLFDWTAGPGAEGAVLVVGDPVGEVDEAQRVKDEELVDFFQNAPIALHWLSGTGHVVWANNTEMKTLGYTAEEYIGQPIMKFCPDEEELVLEIFKQLGSGNAIKDVPVRFRRKDGKVMDLLIDSNVNYTKAGEFNHTRCFIRDDTARKVREAKAATVLAEVKRSLALLDGFMRRVVHVIRTPMMVVQGELSAARDALGRDESLELALAQASEVVELTADVQDLMLLEEGGGLNVTVRPFRVDAFAAKILRDFSTRTKNYRLLRGVVECAISTNVAEMVSDENVLRRAVLHLLKNAATATMAKGEHVHLRISRGAEAIVVSVEDDGCGLGDSEVFSRHGVRVPDEATINAQPNLPENTRARLDSSVHLSSGKEGLGIGLALTYVLLRELGSELRYETTPEGRTRFYFHLDATGSTPHTETITVALGDDVPVATPVPTDPPAPAGVHAKPPSIALTPSVHGSGTTVTGQPTVGPQHTAADVAAKGLSASDDDTKLVLIVEDSPMCAKLLSKFLQKMFIASTIAENGAVALDRLDADPLLYSLILCDLRMPVLDGFGTIKGIRQRGLTIPTVALTGEAANDLQTECFEAGFDAFHTKPLKRPDLVNLLNQFHITKGSSE